MSSRHHIVGLTDRDSVNHVTSLMVLVLYFAVWIAVRFDAIAANVLFTDDFLYFVDHSGSIIDYTSCGDPHKDYRWISFGIRCFAWTTIPSVTSSIIPKLLSGLFLAGFCFYLFKCLKSWAVPTVIALLTPIIFISHPIINEITLWNITVTYPLCLLFCAFSYFKLTHRDPLIVKVLAVGLLLIVVLIYEFYITTFLIFVLSEPLIKYVTGQKIEWRRSIWLMLVFIAISAFYIIQVKLTNALFPLANESIRGIIEITSAGQFMNEKLHGIFNLLVNVFATPISFYTSLNVALSKWESIILIVIVSVFLLHYWNKRRVFPALLVSAALVVLVIVPTLPILASSQSPESWRTSVPVLFSFTFCLILLGLLIQLFAQRLWSIQTSVMLTGALLTIPAVLLANVSYSEAQLRVKEIAVDDGLIDEIKSYWHEQGLNDNEYRVGRISEFSYTGQLEDFAAQELSVAYHRRGLASAFSTDFAWRGKLIRSGLNVIELQTDDKTGFIDGFIENCHDSSQLCAFELFQFFKTSCVENSNYRQQETGFRLVHDKQKRITAICL